MSFRRRTPKIVPMEMFTSMFEEPSSGSKTTTYLERGSVESTLISSISSLAMAAQWRILPSDAISVSFATSSSFITRSPCTLVSPV